MGTTCVAMYFLDDHIIIGHVGDSRCYRVRGPELVQLTEDHSLINDYIRMKRVTPEEAENWPHKNVIVRALGMKESVQVDILTEKPHIGDTYLKLSRVPQALEAWQKARILDPQNKNLAEKIENTKTKMSKGEPANPNSIK
jgi:hypothetical protein